MNRFYILLIMVSIALAGLFAFANKDPKPSEPARQQTSWNTVKSDVANGGQLIDVRTPAEYNDGHIENATNLSLQDIQAGTLPPISKDKPVYVYCRSGNRSAEAASRLKAAGYRDVTDLGAISNVQSLGATLSTN